MDEQQEEADRGTVFPDSGGYAGLGSARPEMVEPYPEALGGFGPAEPQPPMPWEDRGDRAGGYPNVAASADVPAPPGEEGPGEWPSSGPSGQGTAAEAWSPESDAGATVPSESGGFPGPDERPGFEPWAPVPGGDPFGGPAAGDARPPAGEAPMWGGPGTDPVSGEASSAGREPWSPSAEPSSWNTPESDPLDAGAPAAGAEPWTPGGGAPTWGGPGTDPVSGDVPVSDREPSSWSPSEPGEPWTPSGEAPSWGTPGPDDPSSPSGDAPWGAPVPAEPAAWSPSEDAAAWSPSEPDEPWSPSGEPSSWSPSGAGEPWSPSNESSSWSPSGAGEPWNPSNESSSWSPSEPGEPWSPSSDSSWSPAGETPSWDTPSTGEPWSPSGGEPWTPSAEPSSWNPSDPGDTWSPSGDPSSWSPSDPGEPWTPSSEPAPWNTPGSDPLGTGTPTPGAGGHWNPGDDAPSWGGSAGDDPLGTSAAGGPSTWDTPGSDPLDPGAPAPGEAWTPSGDTPSWGSPDPDPLGSGGGWNAADPLGDRPVSGDGYDDELSGSAGPLSWTPQDREPSEYGWGSGPGDAWTGDGYHDELSGPRPTEPEQTGGLGTGSGNTWAFDRNDPRLPDAVREAEQRRRDDTGGGVRHDDWGTYDQGGPDAGPSQDDPLAALADLQARSGGDEGSSAPAPDGGATQMFDPPRFDDDQGASTQMFSPLAPDGPGEDDGRPPAGVPSDLGSVPSYGRRRAEEGYDDGYDGDGYDDEYDEYDEYDDRPADEGYDDGFTPADYGMPDKPRRSRRRMNIQEDFPEFDDRTLGNDAGDGYPGYDGVDFLADTEPGANQTLWLGVASLVPFVGLVTALLALLVTGPKAKREIRDSRGELDGLGLITTGTVFAVVGIVISVISLLLVIF
ncbi:hypothetical protein IDM40_16960 [Nocardiopsis sp. HNM0947]|uniref:DUF4190 domain-containing protein n=1 Tax=Nocardiopsis coralli TaxID=2772213 RepID=A0ABR9P9M6_9ACTN|nr:hypothetical protein [Nocardiopsis coralli]MBE3000380.1 hypothetical protein [Nocardiopsis coralli]